MNYSKMVPDRELCERMSELNICQDEPELWWRPSTWRTYDGKPDHIEWTLETMQNGVDDNECVIAPTTERMTEELPMGIRVYWQTDHDGRKWFVEGFYGEGMLSSEMIYSFDKCLPNAIAKALIAIKENENAGR